MDFNTYQRMSGLTAIYPGRHGMDNDDPMGLVYTVLGLSGEAGELANKVKKIMRDGTIPDRESLIGELGDILWYAAMVADELDITLEQAASYNLAKLGDRAKRGVIGGSGDNR